MCMPVGLGDEKIGPGIIDGWKSSRGCCEPSLTTLKEYQMHYRAISPASVEIYKKAESHGPEGPLLKFSLNITKVTALSDVPVSPSP